jgi:hypothetical protein
MAEGPQRRSKVLNILMVVAAAVLDTVLSILSLVSVISSQAFLLGMLLVFLALGAIEAIFTGADVLNVLNGADLLGFVTGAAFRAACNAVVGSLTAGLGLVFSLGCGIASALVEEAVDESIGD